MTVISEAAQRRTGPSGRRRPRPATQIPTTLALLVLVVLFGIPFVWIALTALKTQSEISLGLDRMLPSRPQLSNFVDALTTINSRPTPPTRCSWPR